MKKWLVTLCIALLVLFLLAGSAWLWLTRSESGARWALARAAGAVERLQYQELSGGLASGITLGGVDFAHAGTAVSAQRLELAAGIDLFAGPLVTVRHLRGRGIDIHLPPGEEAEQSEGPAFDLSMLASPVEVVVEEVDLQGIAIHAGAEPIRIARVALAGRYGDELALDRLSVESEAGRASATGHWTLERRGRGQLTLEAETELSDGSVQSGRIELSGRLDALDFELTSNGPASLNGSGQVRDLPRSPGIDAEMTGSVTGWPDLPADIEDLAVSLSGQPSDWRAESSARVSGPEIPPGEWSLALSGSTQSLTIETMNARLLDGRITGSGQLDWSASAPASRANLHLESLDLTPLYPEWPHQGRISGELAVATQGGVIEVESLELSAEPGELSVTGSGRIDPAGDDVDLTLEWRQFAWPPVTDDAEPLVASESGRIHVTGRISDWQAQVEAMLESPQTPSARIEASASGSGEAAEIERLSVDAGEHGALALDGRVAWQPTLSADVNLALDAFDPGVFVSELPGRIDGRAAVRFERGERLRIDIGVEELSGRLRGQALAGSGRVAWVDDRPESADLELQLGDNRIALDNRESAAWQVELEAVSLEQLWPTLAGQASLAGQLSPEAGKIDMTGQVEDLRYAEYNLEEADIELAFAWLERPEIDLSVTANNLDLRPWDRVEQLELTLAGTCARHSLELNASGARGDLDLAANGRLAECLEGKLEWRGEIARLYLGETLAGDWRLAEPLPLGVSASRVDAGAACLTTAADTPALLCLEHLDVGATGRVVTRVEQVPMDLLLLPIDPVFSLTTPLSGRVEAEWDAAGLSRVDGQLQLGAGVVKAIGDDQELLVVDSVRLDMKPGEDTALTVDLRARLEGQTRINGQARVADLRNLTGTRLDGEAQLDLPDIAAFAHLIPRVDRIGGAANGRIELAGPLTGPSVSGRLSVDRGKVVHAPLGLDIHDIELTLAGSADRATLEGHARSGDGELALSGEARLLDEGWRLDSEIRGEQFAFAGADWLELTASPRVSLQAQPDRVRIDGDIHIDRLRGGLPPGTADRVQPSPDIEVAGEQDERDVAAAPARRRVEGRLGIDLGEQASLAMENFQTELAGELELIWSGPPKPEGRGTIRLPEGSYRAYGQNLEISGGEVIFTGQPIDNPRLDIRAVRDIFGDPEVEAAGVHIAGSARNPDIELYTDPPTSQEKALAYVVTGSDFDHAGGQGALNVGFYLLPRLFVSYGVGLFETGNVLSGRYEFSRHWGVRVVSGERDTGVDLSYTVNN
jgi:translocation and assembly module TamB